MVMVDMQPRLVIQNDLRDLIWQAGHSGCIFFRALPPTLLSQRNIGRETRQC
jgi:hypothetical protein